MSIYTTLKITREDAQKLVLEHALGADDEKLEDMAFEAWGKEHCYNFHIVSEYDNDDDYTYKSRRRF